MAESPFAIALLVLLCAYLGVRYYKQQAALKNSSVVEQPKPQQQSKPKPDPTKPFTLDELKPFDGSDESKPVLVGCNGVVFDVSAGKSFYGKGGPYNCFAGRDASRMLAKMVFEYESSDVSDLSAHDRNTLDDWFQKFSMKYDRVGVIADTSRPNSGKMWLEKTKPTKTD